LISLAWLKNYGKGILVDIWGKLSKLEEASDEFGLSWPNALEILKQIKSECLEIEEQLLSEKIDNGAVQEEIGDLLHATTSLAWFCGFNSEKILLASAEKFEKRLNMIKILAKEQGLVNLQGQDFDALMQFWQTAKRRLEKKCG
jgi:uncharacterized protein YabN with tetrapyrrole methylase and pyrophosphatase domain